MTNIEVGTTNAGQLVTIAKVKGGWAVLVDGVRVRGVIRRTMLQKNQELAMREARYAAGNPA